MEEESIEEMSTICWSSAIEMFNKTLTKDDKKRINIAVLNQQNFGGISELLNAIGIAKAKFNGTRGVHEAVVQKIAYTLSRYAAVLDVMIQQQPGIAAVVWGSIRFLLQVAVNEGEVIEAIGEGIADIVEQIARWHKYLQLYPTSSLKEKISSLYAQIINFLVRAKSYYNKPWAVRLAKAAISPDGGKFGRILKAIKKESERIEKEAMVTAHQDRSIQWGQEKCEFQKQQNFRQDSRNAYTAISTNFKYIRERGDEISHLMRYTLDLNDQQFQDNSMDKHADRAIAWLRPKYTIPIDIPDAEEGTCTWILEHSTYQDWIAKRLPQMLWICGMPGCGKSVMAKFLSSQMDSSVTITYYFRGSDDKESATPVSLARSVLAHLLRERSVKSSPQYSRFLETIYPSSIGRDEPQKCQFERLWAIIAEVSECLESLTMIVDALDECRSCSDLDVLLSSLKDLTSRPTTRIIVFSRLHGKIETAIKDSVVIEMDATTVTTDINLYLNAMIDRSQQLKPLRSEILARAKESCDGMFQWAKMMIDSLQKARTRKMQRVKIQQFPEGLFAAYEKMMRESAMQMGKDDLQLRRHIFLLILSASRLLTPDELALALALQDSNRYLDETDEILDIREVVLQLCWPLATVSKGYVRLVHMSVRDFLVHPRSEKNDTFSKEHGLAMTFEDSNTILARKCFNRLSLQENRNPNRIAALLRKNVYQGSMTSDSEDTDLDAEKSTVFYDYAATNWQIHLTAVPEPDRGLLIQAEIFLHGREFVKWGEYLYDLKSDAGPIEEVKGILKLWYTKLPPASRDQLHIDRYFSGPYRELSMFYGKDGGDKVLPYLPLYRLGEFYLMAANPESAYKVKRVVANGLAEVLGKRHPLTLRAMSTLALDSIITSRMRDAEKIYSEISQLQLEIVGEDHPDGYESLLYVALAQYYMTKFEESASTSARSQAGLFRLLGPRHNLFLTGQLFNAYDIAELGRLEEARYMLEDIHKYRVSILGSDNAMALMAQVALGQLSRKLGDFETAEHHLEQAFEARQRIWGLTIFSSVDTAIHLIILNREMGRPKHAQRYIDIISKPGRADLYFERHCQVEHLQALLLIDNGQFQKPQEILQSILNRSSELGRESNNRALLWVRLTLATILRDNNQKDKASMLFTDIVTEDYETGDEASSLVGEPEPPKVLQIAEDALRLVRIRKYKEAEALLKENELKWVRQDDFWLQTGGPAADTAWMKGP